MVLRALDMIEKGYQNKITQTDLAEKLGISSQYFSYIFSRHVGEGFAAFLKEYRIRQAIRLFEEGEVDKNEIAYKVGFSDVKYFYRVFREVTGKKCFRISDGESRSAKQYIKILKYPVRRKNPADRMFF